MRSDKQMAWPSKKQELLDKKVNSLSKFLRKKEQLLSKMKKRQRARASSIVVPSVGFLLTNSLLSQDRTLCSTKILLQYTTANIINLTQAN